MYRASVVLFCLLTITGSILAITLPHSELRYLLTVTPLLTIGRIMLASLLLVWALVNHHLETNQFRWLVSMFGFALVATCLWSFSDSSSIVLRPLDLFVWLDGGIFALVSGLERIDGVEYRNLTLPTRHTYFAHRLRSLDIPNLNTRPLRKS